MGLKAKLLTTLWPVGILFGAVLGVVLYYQFPQYYNPGWYLGTYFLFMIMETVILLFAEQKSNSATAKQMVNVYLLTKVIKVILSLVFITIYVLVVKENIKSFVLIYMIFYLFFLFVETKLFTLIEKQLKEKNKTTE